MARTEQEVELAQWGAEAALSAFAAYQAEFRHITRRARSRFEARDWQGAQEDARERLEVRGRFVREIVAALYRRLGDAASDRGLWAAMKRRYSALAASRRDLELAESFWNSVTRQVFATVGVDPKIDFVDPDFETIPGGGEHVYRIYGREPTSAALVARILQNFAFEVPYRDLAGDAALAGAEIDRYLGSLEDRTPLDAVEMARPVFFRNKGAYLVGRIRRGALVTPILFALMHEEDGIAVDAVLLAGDDASRVFSFTRSYFLVDVERPHDVVAFLRSILPQKRTSELYISIGYNKHGKTELYREILRHLDRTRDRFQLARGDRGMVMIVFTLPSLDIVFKVIRDRFAPPKATTRQEVMQKYQLVFRHDRAGRLVDAQEFEHLAFARDRFAAECLAELESEAKDTVEIVGDRVHIRHLYAERRVTPLNLFIRSTDEWSAIDAVLDYGQAIKDLAATNTFPGDLLLKNFGVTRTGRVIFYDYDELCLVTDCRFREIPRASGDEEESSGEPWFYVGEDDVFPEEFLPFLGLPDPLRTSFLEVHADLLSPAFWRDMQERIRAGEIADIFPYRQEQRLRRRR